MIAFYTFSFRLQNIYYLVFRRNDTQTGFGNTIFFLLSNSVGNINPSKRNNQTWYLYEIGVFWYPH